LHLVEVKPFGRALIPPRQAAALLAGIGCIVSSRLISIIKTLVNRFHVGSGAAAGSGARIIA
jgi:hypothetical protein